MRKSTTHNFKRMIQPFQNQIRKETAPDYGFIKFKRYLRNHQQFIQLFGSLVFLNIQKYTEISCASY